VAFNLFRVSIISFFYAKRETSFDVSTFRGSLFLGGSLLLRFANICDIFIATFGGSLLLRGHYFWNFMVMLQSSAPQ